MKFSLWNQYFDYNHSSVLSKHEVIEKLKSFYESKNPKVIESTENGLTVIKGSIWASLFCVGPETWCRNIVAIELKDSHNGTEVFFNINLKIPGFTVGKNFLLAEARNACKEI